jgi:hypothetical protein
MKTSNKLLITVIGVFFIGAIVFAAILKINAAKAANWNILHVTYAKNVVGKGAIATQTYKVGAFKGVRIDVSSNIEIKDGKPNVVIRADKTLLPFIRAYVTDGKLQINSADDVALVPTKKIHIIITCDLKNLNAITLEGNNVLRVDSLKSKSLTLVCNGQSSCYLSGRVEKAKLNLSGAGLLIAKNLAVKDLDLDLSGCGKAYVTGSHNVAISIEGAGAVKYVGNPEKKAETVTLDVAGSGEALLSGKVKNFSVTVSGSGSVDAHKLHADNVKTKVTGSGDVILSALKSLNVTVYGSGAVKYYGKPKKLNPQIYGSGSLVALP